MHLSRTAVAALTVLVLAACGGAGSTGCNLPIVNPPVFPMPTLISPGSGATGVSTGPLDVTIGSATGAELLYLKNAGLAFDAPGNFVPATNYRQANPPSNDVRIGTFTGLASQTTYQVYANVTIGFPYNPCGINPALSGSQPKLLGTFTTR